MIEYFFFVSQLSQDWIGFSIRKKKQIKLRDEIKLHLQIRKYQNNRASFFAYICKNVIRIHFRDGFGLGNLHGYPRYKIVGRTEEGKIFNSMS